LTSEEKGKVSSIWKDSEYCKLFEKRASNCAFLCGELKRELRDQKKEFKGILATLPAWSRETHLTHNKVKRFAILIPIIVSAIGISLGLYNSKCLGALEGNTEALSNKHKNSHRFCPVHWQQNRPQNHDYYIFPTQPHLQCLEKHTRDSYIIAIKPNVTAYGEWRTTNLSLWPHSWNGFHK